LDPLFKLCGYPFTSHYIPLWGHVEGNISNDHSAISIKYIQIIDSMAVLWWKKKASKSEWNVTWCSWIQDIV